MSAFCNQCSNDLDLPEGELAKLLPPEMYSEETGALALCEGCGTTVVDIHGNCIAMFCLKNHYDKKKKEESIAPIQSE